MKTSVLKPLKKMSFIIILTFIFFGCNGSYKAPEGSFVNGKGKVNPKYYMTPTAVFLKFGDNFTIKATGEVCWERNYNCTGADGNSKAWGLYGKIGEEGIIFKVGANFEGVSREEGELFLIIPELDNLEYNNSKDDYYKDNMGFYDVEITTPSKLEKDEIHSQKHDDFDYFEFGEINIVNDTWGKGTIADYKQFVFKDSMYFGWEWEWTNPANSSFIKGYPHLLFGINPWGGRSTQTVLPSLVNDIQNINISYTLNTTTKKTFNNKTKDEDCYNLAFDLWVTNNKHPNKQNILAEIMVWEHTQNIDAFGELIENNVFNTYKLYQARNKNNDISWDIFTFVPKSSQHINNKERHIELARFIQFLVEKKLISNTDYISNVSFGNEIHKGAANSTFSNYKIDIKLN